MGRKSGSLKAKRATVPSFWKIPKKEKRFVIRTAPGPHPKRDSYPLLVFLRDILRITKTRKETLKVLNEGSVKVDGKVVRSSDRPIGLMDVVDIPKLGTAYRLIPHKGGLLPAEIEEAERELKLCVVRSKSTIGGSRTAYGLHDGRVVVAAQGPVMKPGDSCLIQLPGQEVRGYFGLNVGELALLVKGERSGEIVTIEDIKTGTFSRERIAAVQMQDGSTSELPTNMLMPLGKSQPDLTVAQMTPQ